MICADDVSIEEQIDRCWWRGDSIGETIKSVHRNSHTSPSFTQVHRRFVNLAQQFCGPAQQEIIMAAPASLLIEGLPK